MKPETVYLQLRKPCDPLFSDKCLLWLASTYAAAGYPLKSLGDLEEPRPGSLLLTNLPVKGRSLAEAGCTVLRLTSSSDRTAALMLGLGRLYGRTPYFHPAEVTGSGRVARRLISLAMRPFAWKTPDSARDYETTKPPAETGVPEGRCVVFRVNVDWDSRGLELLERWCENYNLHPTLAVAGSEVIGHRKRVLEFAARCQVEVASHSFSHYVVLSSRGRKRQRREVEDNQRFLEDLFSRPVSGFVAPYIKYDRTTFELLQEYGYRWFIRSWMLHPVGLPGFRLLDLGVNFYFAPGWEKRLPGALARSDLVLQLHLRDLVKLEQQLEWMLGYLTGRGVGFIDCGTYFERQRERCFL